MWQRMHPHGETPPHRRVLAIEAEAARRQEAALKAQADDGWTVVVRGKGRNKGAAGLSVRGAGVSKDAAAKAAAAKKAVAGIDDFYRFQKKEKARNGASGLSSCTQETKHTLLSHCTSYNSVVGAAPQV